MTFRDAAVVFSPDLWARLSPEERELYGDVMLESLYSACVVGTLDLQLRGDILLEGEGERGPRMLEGLAGACRPQSPSDKLISPISSFPAALFPLWLILQKPVSLTLSSFDNDVPRCDSLHVPYA